jgi:uncharacterized protein
MRIVVAGSSGLLGSHLRTALRARGDEVVRLVRRPAEAPDEVSWDPAEGQLDPAALSTVDAVVNFAGAGVGDHRWTDAYKRVLVSSRVDTTATLAAAIAALPEAQRPRTFLGQSGVNFYGDTGDLRVDEQTPPGEGFLADLCRVWEAATRPAEDAGVRVVHMRTGLPLAKDGFLKPLLRVFNLGIGGRLGNGREYHPWLSMVDWQAAMLFLLDRDDVSGPVNVVGPDPVTNAELTRALAAVLHRPAVFMVPRFALRIALGEFSNEALASLRVMPGVLTDAGFTFQHRDVTSAIRAGLSA